jgi:hypothetical protein
MTLSVSVDRPQKRRRLIPLDRVEFTTRDQRRTSIGRFVQGSYIPASEICQEDSITEGGVKVA